MTDIPSVRRYIFDMIDGDPDATYVDVERFYGWPEEPSAENIVVAGPDPETTKFAALGGGRLDIEFAVTVHVEVRRPGLSAFESDERGWEIANGILTQVRNDPSLGEQLLVPALPNVAAWENYADDVLWVTLIQLQIGCKIRV